MKSSSLASNSFLEFVKEGIESSIPKRFEEEVENFPTRLAVKTQSQELTYEELNKIAHAKKPIEEVEDGKLVAWVFLIIGLLMMVGGIGYLVYYYKFSPAAKKAGVGERAAAGPRMVPGGVRGRPGVQPGIKPRLGAGIIDSWKGRLKQLKKAEKKR